PIALFMVFWYWKSPRGLTQTSPATMITAGVLASLQIISWAGFFIYLFTRHA
ncbi:MAG: hypothetical protein RLY20_3412, partial [Verrucomicrobiota bacterium]